jgi:hypothetical protein
MANSPTDLVTELRRGKLRPGLRLEAADEIERLRTIVRSVNRVVSQNEPHRWKVERIVAALDGKVTS